MALVGFTRRSIVTHGASEDPLTWKEFSRVLRPVYFVLCTYVVVSPRDISVYSQVRVSSVAEVRTELPWNGLPISKPENVPMTVPRSSSQVMTPEPVEMIVPSSACI